MNERLRIDLLVIGGGMTGLTAAAIAARQGLEVLVVEKAPDIGGSAAMSSGYLWTAPTLDALQWEDPTCDVSLGRALADHFLEGIDWVQSLGLELSHEITGIYGFGRGYQIDIAAYLARCRSAIEARGGWISTGVTVEHLVETGGRVTGATARDRDGGTIAIDAKWTLLATGGLQGDPALRRRYVGPEADGMLLRANQFSTGDGLRLATAVGAGTTGGDGFYGHLIAHPIRGFEPKDYLNFSQLHSGYCLLLNASGGRFTDESRGDHMNNQATLRQVGGRGIIVGDEHVRQTYVMAAYIDGMDILDKLEFASEAGANYAVADTVGQLAEQVHAWGYDSRGVAETINHYNELIATSPKKLDPSSERYSRPLDSPPYFALEVQPAITFAYAGLATNADAEIVGNGGPVGGLLAGGVDVGGVYKRGYAGALARGLVSGMRAALTASGEPTWARDGN